MYLMPQLPTPFADMLAQQLCELSVTDCRQRRALDHTNRVFSPTGGTRINDSEYSLLRDEFSIIAEKVGYPEDNAAARTRFDVEIAIALHQKFRITENEAAKPGVWNFLSCIALPDLVRWRFSPSDVTPIDRFIAGPKNAFERLWWRAHAYHDPKAHDCYWLIREIGEDESVGMMERTALSGIRPFVTAALRALVECYKTKPPVARSELMREAMKRFRRLGGVLALDSLSDPELSELCKSVFLESVSSPKTNPTTKTHDLDKAIRPKVGPTNVQDGAGISLEEIAWLEIEMKRKQGGKSNK